MTRDFLLLATAVSFFAQGAAADESIEDRFAACAAMTDEAARLNCFDRAADDLKPPVVVAEPPAPEPAAAPVPAAAPAPAAAAKAPTEPLAMFGMNPELASKQEPEKVELTQISAVVVEITKRTRGERVMTLDNGQVWTEKGAESYFRVKVGDTVVIKKISMGGYRMVGRGNRASAVRRIK
jgi:hypothetical protein